MIHDENAKYRDGFMTVLTAWMGRVLMLSGSEEAQQWLDRLL